MRAPVEWAPQRNLAAVQAEWFLRRCSARITETGTARITLCAQLWRGTPPETRSAWRAFGQAARNGFYIRPAWVKLLATLHGLPKTILVAPTPLPVHHRTMYTSRSWATRRF